MNSLLKPQKLWYRLHSSKSCLTNLSNEIKTASKYFVHDREASKTYAESRLKTYTDIMQKELDLVRPNLCVCLGKKAKEVLDKCMINAKSIVLPHLSGTARGAIVKRFPILEDIKATAENVANVYVDEIVESLK